MKMFLNLLILIILFVLIGGIFYFLSPRTPTLFIYNSKVQKGTLNITIADNEAQRIQGLSGTERLPANNGMLFVFKEETNTQFWMIDMKYPLDILFINSSRKIIDIKSNQLPCVSEKDCPYINSNSKFKYVLEVNSGYADLKGIKIGDSVRF